MLDLDNNPASTTALGSFHGTGVSLFQFPTLSNLGEKQDDLLLIPGRFTIARQLCHSASCIIEDHNSVCSSTVSSPKKINRQVHGKALVGLCHSTTRKKRLKKGTPALHASILDVYADLPTTLTHLCHFSIRKQQQQL